MADETDTSMIEITAAIVGAYVSNNRIPATGLPQLIADVYSSFSSLGTVVVPAVELVPAVSIKKSITPDYLICLEDGKHFKSLKRHLSSSYGISPEEYRAKWGLPSDYPMVAPNYAATRSTLAKTMGLGRKAGETVAAKKPASGRKPGRPPRVDK